MSGEVRFVRIRGRIVPIKGKGGSGPSKGKKRGGGDPAHYAGIQEQKRENAAIKKENKRVMKNTVRATNVGFAAGFVGTAIGQGKARLRIGRGAMKALQKTQTGKNAADRVMRGVNQFNRFAQTTRKLNLRAFGGGIKGAAAGFLIGSIGSRFTGGPKTTRSNAQLKNDARKAMEAYNRR